MSWMATAKENCLGCNLDPVEVLTKQGELCRWQEEIAVLTLRRDADSVMISQRRVLEDTLCTVSGKDVLERGMKKKGWC